MGIAFCKKKMSLKKLGNRPVMSPLTRDKTRTSRDKTQTSRDKIQTSRDKTGTTWIKPGQ